jgi:hypothetical protein
LRPYSAKAETRYEIGKIGLVEVTGDNYVMTDSKAALDLERTRQESETQSTESDLIIDLKINERLASLIHEGVSYSKIQAAIRDEKNNCKKDILESLEALLDRALSVESQPQVRQSEEG